MLEKNHSTAFTTSILVTVVTYVEVSFKNVCIASWAGLLIIQFYDVTQMYKNTILSKNFGAVKKKSLKNHALMT